MNNFAVFVSGHGGNLQAIIKAVKNKKINASLKLVFSNKQEAYALVRAYKAGIPTLYLNPHDFKSREEYDVAILKELKKHKIDFVVLAGYMRLVSGVFIDAYPNKILNIHPSLIPAFKGAHGIRDAYDYGAKITGVTIHFVVEEMDAGAIIAQMPVKIEDTDSLLALEDKIHKVEHRLYPKVIDLFAKGKIKIKGRKTNHCMLTFPLSKRM